MPDVVSPPALHSSHDETQVAAVPAGGWLLNSGVATAVGKIIISAAKAKSVKTINLVRLPVLCGVLD